MTGPEPTLPEIVASLEAGNAVVCLSKCWPCMFDSHFDPPRWHTYADDEDVEHAKSLGLPDPSTKRCGCPCASAPTPSGGTAPTPQEEP